MVLLSMRWWVTVSIRSSRHRSSETLQHRVSMMLIIWALILMSNWLSLMTTGTFSIANISLMTSRSHLEFDVAEIALEVVLNNEQTDCLIDICHHCAAQLEKFTFKNHKDFTKDVISIPFADKTWDFDVYYRDLWEWATDLHDPHLFPYFHFDAQCLAKFNGQSFERFVDEPFTAQDFWDAQLQLLHSAKPLAFIFFGTAKGYPIVARLVNLPTHICNSQGMGGGYIVGWLPVVLQYVKEDKAHASLLAWANFKATHTSHDSEAILATVQEREAAEEREEVLKDYGLCDVVSQMREIISSRQELSSISPLARPKTSKPEAYCPLGYLLLRCVQLYLKLDMYALLEVHTMETISSGRHTHLAFAALLWAKGATCNYNTKLNEKMHGSLKDLYLLRMNFCDVAEQILRINMWQVAADHIYCCLFKFDDHQHQLDEEDLLEEEDFLATVIEHPVSTSNSFHVKLGSKQPPLTFDAIQTAHQADQAFINFRVKLNDFLNANIFISEELMRLQSTALFASTMNRWLIGIKIQTIFIPTLVSLIFHYQIVRTLIILVVQLPGPLPRLLRHPAQTSLHDRVQLKRLYHSISTLEKKILNKDPNDLVDEEHAVLQGFRRGHEVSDEDLQQQKRTKLISDHEWQVILCFPPNNPNQVQYHHSYLDPHIPQTPGGLRLTDIIHNKLMEISLALSIPASLQVIPTKYNIIICLWMHAFCKLLKLFMLFTNIQLDNFSPTLARFIKHIKIEGAEEREWIMIAGTGSPAVKVAKKCQVAPTFCDEDSEEKWMDVDDKGASQASPALSDTNTPAEFPLSFKLALELAFLMLSFILRNPTWKASPFACSTLNPYISVMLTFLATITKHAETLSFFANPPPRDIFTAQGLVIPTAGHEQWSMLMSGCAPPLSEDWCLSGMEWISRKVFKCGYWKSREERWMSMEVEILDVEEGVSNSMLLVELSVCFSHFIAILWTDRVQSLLSSLHLIWTLKLLMSMFDVDCDDSVDVDVDDEDAESKEMSEQSEEDENDHEEVKDLKVCQRYLRSLLISGYTILVLDTNIILSSLLAVTSIIEIPVIMELDGLSLNPSQLGEAAQEAIAYITSHICSHPDVDLINEDLWDCCMDDLILKATIWQDEYGVDHSALLKNMPPVQDNANAVKVVLLSLDCLFCLKACSHQLAAAGEKDLAAILASGT
ncbi:uncharacterized protein BJ212DRAFT_1591443 [Suillus subaureus]|uniref:PIN domain-containing protein n=1 Tax=Suillus subaureus TaxID=48587 RepID=A0A9P7DRF7_9AGAM|nr:uncharacterized protein BJ212DRAFT_1591443 [Suillus subaureus]KAG1801161.1 hypothetical protein BJ212DRAFT_1591443 [Suillus subaureus]